MNAPTTVEPTGVSVRHDARIAALVALLAAVLTVAWFARALRTADPLDWVWCLVPAAVGLLQLLVVRDARTPLLVADELGVHLPEIDLGGGFGIAYTSQHDPLTPADLAARMADLVQREISWRAVSWGPRRRSTRSGRCATPSAPSPIRTAPGCCSARWRRWSCG